MIVMAGSFRRYGVPARAGKSTGKVCRAAGAVRYNRYSTSGRRSRNRHACSQSTRSRGRVMQASMRIVKRHHRVTNARVLLTLQRKVTSYTSPYSGHIDAPFS